MAEQKKVNLRDVAPLRPVDDGPPTQQPVDDVDRIGMPLAEASESASVVGVSAVKPDEPAPVADEDPLDKLRRD